MTPPTTSPTPSPADREPVGAPRPGPTAGDVAVTAVFRKALRDMFVLLGALTVVGVAVGALVAGTSGVWGALLGVAIALFFSATTVLSMLKTSQSSPTTTAAVVMGGWLVKMVVLVVVLAVLRGMDFYDRYVFAAVLLVGVIGSAYLDYRAVQGGRIPYVDPEARDRSV
ncbi:hypothetical protein [Oerskovia flava]|uniref:hypothetical protein n=1 Tax=Oerskovia flava TaxID=2986422 RepID=UPI00223EC871|nr:hypothetical protein [Oerskovia sp. JB1-3-2]